MSRADEIRKERAERGYDPTKGRQRLGVNESAMDRKAKHYRYFNDAGDRIFQAKQAGYSVTASRQGEVKKDSAGMGSEAAAYAGTQQDGSAMKAVLMEIPIEIYEEDQLAKRRRIDERVGAIAAGKVAEAAPEDQAAFDAHRHAGLKFG